MREGRADPWERPAWSLDMVLAWIATRRIEHVDDVAAYSRRTKHGARPVPRAGGLMLSVMRNALARLHGVEDRTFQTASNSGDWLKGAAAQLQAAGERGDLSDAATAKDEDGAPRSLSAAQWSDAVIVSLGSGQIGLRVGKQMLRTVEIDRAAVMRLWPGRRGRRSRADRLIGIHDHELDSAHRREALEADIFAAITQGDAPWDADTLADHAIRKHRVGWDAATRARAHARARAEAEGLPAADLWKNPPRKPYRTRGG